MVAMGFVATAAQGSAFFGSAADQGRSPDLTTSAASTDPLRLPGLSAAENVLAPPPAVAPLSLNQVAAGTCGDLTGDDAVNVFDAVATLQITVGSTLPSPAQVVLGDINRDDVIDIIDAIAVLQASVGLITLNECGPRVATLVSSSPSPGEGSVSLTRETILEFSKSLSAPTVGETSITAVFAGQTLAANRRVSSDGRRVTLFYDEPLPAGARVRITLDGDLLQDFLGEPVDVDGDGVAGGVATIDFDTASLTPVPGTEVWGFVFDSYNKKPDGSNIPVVGATIRVDGMPSSDVVTDVDGFFTLTDIPAPLFFVHVDGSTATGAPEDTVYVTVGKAFHSVAGQSTQLTMDGEVFDIFLPPMDLGDIQPLSTTEATDIVFGTAGTSELTTMFPTVDPAAWALTVVTFPLNSATDNDGNPATEATIIPVSADRLPAPLPPWVSHQLDIAVITGDGATNFDVPAPACFPNLPDGDTGLTLNPGDKSALWSFDHDLGDWRVTGSMTVSDDGLLVCTDPGTGILAPGWHGTGAGTNVTDGEEKKGDKGKDEEPGTKETPPSEPCSDCDCVPCERSQDEGIGDPVYPFSGEFYETVTDLWIPGRGLDFEWTRKYRSKIGPDTEMGNGWDFNYNLSLEADNEGNRILRDGNSRSDVYSAQTDGSWSRSEFFRRLEEGGDGTHTMSFRDGGFWAFRALDSGVAPGKIAAISDRNGNTLSFSYDGQGRLSVVTDTLGREIAVGYDADGFISSVTDFVGRVVQYDYYDGIEPGGNLGDLKSVTSPTVTGTPNDNDFPDGKTVSYTYSTGFVDRRLNHNLLTITDGRRNDPSDPTLGDGPYLTNNYDPTLDPEAINFDRVIRQVWGDPTDIMDFVYVPLSPVDANGHAVMKTIVNDRNGNVKEFFYDDGNRLVKEREYTGRANRSLPTTQLNNRPTGPFRPTDPRFFETRHEWNGDSLGTRTVYPEGNIVETGYAADADPDTPARARGTLLSEIRIPDAARGGDQQKIVITSSYEPLYNEMRTMTEPRGNDPTYVPQNGGPNSPERYTTIYTFDYEEACDFTAIGAHLGQDPSDVEQLLSDEGMCSAPLGDVNGDGLTDQVSGNVIRVQHPTVTLLAASNQAAIEGGILQPIVELTSYNQFGQTVSTTDAEGNVTTYEYYPENDPDGDGQDLISGLGTGQFGYLKQVTRDTASGPARNSGTDPTPTNIRSSYSYDPVGNIVRQINGRGIATDFVVNELNQVVQITFAAAHGLLTPEPVEPEGLIDFQYIEHLAYDANNNLASRQIEDRGDTSGVGADNTGTGTAFVDYGYEYDILNNITEVREEVSDSEVLITRYRYDPNRNQVLEILPEGNATTTVYDERDLPFQETPGALSPPGLVTLFAGDPTDYDLRGGPPSTNTYHYDWNQNLVEMVDASDTDSSSSNNSSKGGDGDRTRFIYDGFDRQTSMVDPVGNQSIAQYDPAGNAVRNYRFGPVGGPSPTADGPSMLLRPVSSGGVVQIANLVTSNLLDAAASSYDELNRVFQGDQVLFVNTTPTSRLPDLADGATDIGKGDLSPGDDQTIPGFPGITVMGRVTTRAQYDRKSRPTFTVQDDGDTHVSAYDGADRLIETIDPEGNIVQWAYDDNHNVIEMRDIDVSQVESVDDEVFVSTYFYDSRDRVQRSVDNLGQTTDFRYDSRDNLVASSDANGPLTGASITRRSFTGGLLTVDEINDFGNVSLMSYDGINRQITQETLLTTSGLGDGVNVGADIFGVKSGLPVVDTSQGGADGLITLNYEWDKNSLPLSETDDNGNQTQYTRDNLDRVATESKGLCTGPALADRCDTPTTITYQYDLDDNVTSITDENGSVVAYQFDALNRRKSSSVNRAPGVVGTTASTYEYDGLSRLTRATDNNEPGDAGDDSVLTYSYDSLSRVIEEREQIGAFPSRAVSTGWRTENLASTLTYPNGRVIEFTYDRLDRPNTIGDQGAPSLIADYDFIGGRGRVLQRSFPGDGTRQTSLDDAGSLNVGFDGVRRPVQLRHLRSDDSLIVGFANSYDRIDNPLGEVKLHDVVNNEQYTYDSAYRLTQFDRNDASAIIPTQSTWTLDGVGNWTQVDGEAREYSSFNEIITLDDGSVTAVLSDDNGNIVDDGTYEFSWDYRNRLRGVVRKSGSHQVAVYTYDASDRRVRKEVTNSGALDGVTHFYYVGQQVLEERDGSDLLTQQYVYGIYIDEPLVLDRNLTGGPSALDPGDQRLFYHQNHLSSTFALTDVTSAIVEGYQYDAYGSQLVFAPGTNGVVDFGGDDVIVPGGAGEVRNPYQFTGRRLDAETDLFYYRARYMDTDLGRFLSRDPIGSFDRINLYEYAHSSPAKYNDPLGMKVKGFIDCPKLNAAQRKNAIADVAQACAMMKKAVKNMKKLATLPPPKLGMPGRAFLPLLRGGKMVSPPHTVITKAEAAKTLNRLWNILMEAQLHVCKGTGIFIECECKCDPSYDAYTRGDTWGSMASLHLCPRFFKKTRAEQTSTIFHEITHYGGSWDEYKAPFPDPIPAQVLERLVPWLAGV